MLSAYDNLPDMSAVFNLQKDVDTSISFMLWEQQSEPPSENTTWIELSYHNYITTIL